MQNTTQESLLQHDSKIYTQRAINFGTFLGGPFITGYLLSENFKVFGEPEKARTSLWVGAGSALLLIVLLLQIPESILKKAPIQLIPFINTLIEYLIVQKYQANKIDEHLDSGGGTFSLWKVSGFSIAVLLVMFSLFFLSAIFINRTPTSDLAQFGQLDHQIYYESSNLPREEITRFGKQLIELRFFDDKIQKQLLIKRTINVYELSIPVKDGAWNNGKALLYFKALRDTLQSLNPEKIILINFTYPDLNTIQASIGKQITRDAK